MRPAVCQPLAMRPPKGVFLAASGSVCIACGSNRLAKTANGTGQTANACLHRRARHRARLRREARTARDHFGERPDQRVDQYMRLREVIEERASRKFFEEQAQSDRPVLLRATDFPR